MDLAVPFVFMFYATQFAEKVEITDSNMQLDFSMAHLKLIKKKQAKLMKPIEGDFYKEKNEAGEDLLIQTIIDDNFFNGFASAFTTIDKMFSMRDLFAFYTNAQPIF